ncbi:NAD(P)-dependent oxidoreductase [Bauldia sp.]|uniref:NAD(P)-dependent oxidoreductase n=1 Tax=Bauldia sp. TaxID=2575872 RepID=UPI003BA98F00
MNQRVGYVGLGAMGAPMLARLARHAGQDAVFGFDIDPAVRDRVCGDAGATPCASLTEIAEAVDVLFSCVPNDEVLRAVYLGEGGVAANTRRGGVTVDCSTVSPKTTRDVHKRLTELGVQHLDASMLGSVRQANEGTISFVVGGDAGALNRVRPLLEILGGMTVHCGGSGAGNTMKLLHQTLVASHAVAVGEAIALCEQVGADADIFYDIVTKGTGLATSRYFEQRVPRIRSGEFSPLFMLKLMAKDARLARAMVESDTDTGAVLPSLDAVIAALTEAEALGWGDEDFSAAYKVAEKRLRS